MIPIVNLGDEILNGEFQAVPMHQDMQFVIIEGKRLWQECLSQSIGLLHPRVCLVGYDTVESYLQAPSLKPGPDAIILHFDQADLTDPEAQAETRKLVDAVAPVPVVVLSDSEDIGQMAAVRDWGASGYVPATIGLTALVDAIKMAASGGFVLTGKGLEGLHGELTHAKPVVDSISEVLTSRQSAVAESLRQGKPNKIIAHELGMCENTVKVHVRNVLKKLNVRNRTEAAFKLNKSHVE